MGYGFSCWQAHERHGCRNHIEFDDLDGTDHNEAERRAGMAGWTIGHFDGQGQIACPDCRNSMWEAAPLGRDPFVIDAIEDFARGTNARP